MARGVGHAIVAGGSIAGLLAARVLAKHFARVTLIERDTPAQTAEPRKGVPQGRHGHVLLLRGQSIMQELFPTLSADLAARGALRIRGGKDILWHHAGDWRVRFDSDLSLLSMSRPLLETTIAEHVRALPNVTVLNGTRAEGLCSHAERTVTGALVRGINSHEQASEIEADLVVDATGRGSSSPQWLQQLGFEPPSADRVSAPVTYATCTFRKSDPVPEWRTLLIGGAPARRNGFTFAIEGNRWLVSLSGYFDEQLPRTHDEFLAFAQSLPVPDLYDLLRHSEPISEVVHYRFAGSVRHHYERLERFPEGLIVLGDAVCCFNPVYGQGMTVSAVEAEILDQALVGAKASGGIEPGFGQRWFRKIQPAVDAAWDSVLVEDYRFPELAGRRSVRVRALQWYLERVHRATYRSPTVTEQFYRVVSFLDPPTSLFRPRVLAEVFAGRGGASAKTSAHAQ